jgi:hypothetical protein
MQRLIAKKCMEIVPVATQTYYLPAYNRQKDHVAPRFPLKKLIDKEEILDIERDITSGNNSDAVEKLQTLNSRLEDFERRMDSKPRRRRI